MLLAVVCMLALLTIWLSVAIPDITKSIQREREVETVNRGKQYIRAIQLYYRKFHAYPPSIDALVNTNNIRFLRKRYIDPMTRKDDWKPVYFGQNKAPLAMGFFGQPLGGVNGATPIAGVGPSGSGGMPGQTGTGFGPTGGGSSNIDSGSIFGGSSPTGGGSPIGSNTGTGPGATGTPTGNTANGSGTGSTDSGTGSSFMSGQNGQTFGGAGIVGVEPASPGASILIYKKMEHYNQWEFTYNPLADMMQQAGANGNAIPPSGSSLTGNGLGPNGTGPVSGPGSDNGTGAGPNPTQPAPMPPDQ